jgi:hypothetical protein
MVGHGDYEQVKCNFDDDASDLDDTSSASLSHTELFPEVGETNPYYVGATVDSGLIHLPNHLTTKVRLKMNCSMKMKLLTILLFFVSLSSRCSRTSVPLALSGISQWMCVRLGR